MVWMVALLMAVVSPHPLATYQSEKVSASRPAKGIVLKKKQENIAADATVVLALGDGYAG